MRLPSAARQMRSRPGSREATVRGAADEVAAGQPEATVRGAARADVLLGGAEGPLGARSRTCAEFIPCSTAALSTTRRAPAGML